MAKRLPPRQQSAGVAMFAGAALVGPILGPLLGGWITENYSWHYAFFINVPICGGLILLILGGMSSERWNMAHLANADWFGVAGVTIGLGSITVLLEEGHREHWFESALIWQLAFASLIGFALVAVGQLRSPSPVIKLSLLRNRGLSSALFLMGITGLTMFITIFAVPQFLAAIAGYNALQSGEVLFVMGIVSVIGSFLYPLLIALIDVRIVVGCAFALLSVGSYLSSRVTSATEGNQFIFALLVFGTGVTLSAIPLQQAAVSAVDVEDSGEATSMFNVARNIGASIGLAALASFLDQRLEFHHWRLNEVLIANDPSAHARLSSASAAASSAASDLSGGYWTLDSIVMREAMVMSFADVFLVLSIASLLAVPLVMLMKPIDPERAKGMMH